MGVVNLRNRKTQRALKKAGIRREERRFGRTELLIGPPKLPAERELLEFAEGELPWNGEQYYDLTPAEAVRNIVKKEKRHESEHAAL